LILFVVLGWMNVFIGVLLIDIASGSFVFGYSPYKLGFFESTFLFVLSILFLLGGSVAAFLSPHNMVAASKLVRKSQGVKKRIIVHVVEDSESTSYELNILDSKRKYKFFYTNRMKPEEMEVEHEAIVFFDKKQKPLAFFLNENFVWLV
jgi:hypothetical protein